MKIIRKFFISYYFFIPIGFYIYGRETSVQRDKTKDYQLFIKYVFIAPLFIPIYLYKNGLPKLGIDSRWKDN